MRLSGNVLNYDDLRWLEFVQQHTDSNIFHHPVWINTITECYGYRPFLVVILDDDGSIQAGLPVVEIKNPFQKRRWVSLPFTDNSKPLAENPEALALLGEYLLDQAKSQQIEQLEIRSDAFQKGFQPAEQYIQTILQLSPDIADVRRLIKGNNLRKLHSAEKNQVEVVIGASMDLMKAFYQLHLETRHRHGLPVQPWCYFQKLQKELMQNGLGFLSMGRIGNEFVAGGVFLYWKETITYKYAASNALGRQSYASDPMIWQAIQWGCDHGMRNFDWGRTDIGDEGLRRFKNRWGSVEYPLNYLSTHPNEKQMGERPWFGWVKKVISKSPMMVSRWSGELLYRYFG